MSDRPNQSLVLAQLQDALHKNWRLGQNMILCWAPHPAGVLTLSAPHYFLGNLTAKAHARGEADDTEQFVREVLGSSHQTTEEALLSISKRLGVSTNFIKLDAPLADPEALKQADLMVRRYGIGFVPSRAVILFDIAEFSLHTPFEQASQLNSLSYSMNSSYSKLKRLGIEVNFARTTTGDGYYVWNRDVGTFPDFDLLILLLLVLIDNSFARREASGNTVPLIRTGFHIGSHYEMFQAEGVNPTLYSYIVGDVTITLARMLAAANAGQIFMGDFLALLPDGDELVGPRQFVEAALREIATLKGLKIADYPIEQISHHWSGMDGDRASHALVDKHGQGLRVGALELEVVLGSNKLCLGVGI